MELQRNYAWALCAPSRAAMQSGRHPLHVNVENEDQLNYNPADPVAGYQVAMAGSQLNSYACAPHIIMLPSRMQ